MKEGSVQGLSEQGHYTSCTWRKKGTLMFQTETEGLKELIFKLELTVCP